MGDSSLVTIFSAIPLLVVIAAVVAGAVAWRSQRRVVRNIAGLLLVLLGLVLLLSSIGVLFGMAAGLMLVVIGLALLIVEHAKKRAA